MEYAVLKPKAGCRVKDPRDYSVLPATGKRVKMDKYWRRRVKDGSVEVVSSMKPAPAPASNQPPSGKK